MQVADSSVLVVGGHCWSNCKGNLGPRATVPSQVTQNGPGMWAWAGSNGSPRQGPVRPQPSTAVIAQSSQRPGQRHVSGRVSTHLFDEQVFLP